MNIIVCNNYEELSKKAADIVAAQVKEKPNCILGLATGSTPLGLYENLCRMHSNGELDFEKVTSFNLDEYYPISPSNDQSYRYFMNKNLFSKINIKLENTFVPNGEATDAEVECIEYDKKIKAYGGIDLQILGIGQNGHIAFNEPATALNANTHLTGLTKSTIEANSRFFEKEEDVPRHALTMGIASIMQAKKIILLANGKSKRSVVSALLNSDIDTNIPATMLKVHHDVTLICDRDAYPGMYLGVDIGGTNIKFGVIDQKNDLVYDEAIHTPKNTDARAIMKEISNKCQNIMAKYPIAGIGVGVPGEIDKKNGTVFASNLPFEWAPIISYLKEDIDLPIYLENDARCAAIAEARVGFRAKNMFMITLGTGIGGGVIIDGNIYDGTGVAGEIGHICIDPDGIKCTCGNIGCLESYASVTALISQTKNAATENPDSVLSQIIAEQGHVSGKTVFDAMDKGCPVAQKVFDNYLSYLATGIYNIDMTFAPDIIVIGGGISKEGDRLLNPLNEKLKEKLCMKADVQISVLQGHAGSIGAALLPKIADNIK